MSAQQIDEKKLERAIRKIKHCLALAQSANENEAATALRQAQALMREYRLTEMDVKLSDVGEVESQFTRAERLAVWERSLAGAVANVFGCTSLYCRQYCSEKDRVIARTSFVGVTPAQHIALYAFEALLIKLKFARKEYVAAVRAGVHRSSYSAETAGDHFALAWVHEVYGKLIALVPKGEDDIPSASHSRDIIVVEAQDKALITEYLATKGVGKARKARDVDIDLNAQIAGMLAGRRVDLHAGIARGGEDTLALSPTA
ncbi:MULTISPECIES: DUF2786 domain-containing protein [unclassified Pseudomonas]|uniref:DUF2786 domain-containing protein n=1 Tax=unclassified Pseudomonas TaxID=196821 RepID=UPI000CD05040|nr:MULTISPECIES: DUF2786 domain-containing protein [unclassified Pseudomonas]POA26371.1 hypothetical protein C1895_06110 [Pseudomonas sp. FW305-3-2-15-E-TSA4]POA44629.1 hypothetical protein C1894_04690 [Pseudomonas sp. FW305-3-2-15-E-TSA2]